MRTLEELQVLLTDFKQKFSEDLGRSYSVERIKESGAFEDEMNRRIAAIVQKRLSHLQNPDFFNFVMLAYNEDVVKLEPPSPTLEVKRRGRPAKTQKDSQ